MKKIVLSLIVSILYFVATAQEEKIKDTLQAEPTNLSEIIVYANKFPESAKTVAQFVQVIKNKTALRLQPNTADVLINSGNVFVQKSQQGGGSPVIRGFEASRVLLMIDGVRMNNAIYRAGHLQNIISVDNMLLDRIEILNGPSSTLYGSDALGGVVSMFTRKLQLSATGKTLISGDATVRYGTANQEARGNITVNIGGKQWASLTSVTYGSFGDMVQGAQRQSAYPDFGKKNFIVQRINGTDSAFTNPDPNKQVSSGYKQIDVTQKFLFQPNANTSHILNIQFSNTNNIPRYDRLSENANGKPSYAEWYYGPQMRNMVAYHFNAQKLNGFFSELAITANYQHIEESRISRRFKSNNKDFRWEQVDVFGATLDLKHYSGKNELHVGAESYTNFVSSTSQRVNIATNAISSITTRYANGPTSMAFNALYAQHTYKFSNRLTLNDGLRFNLVKLDAVFADTTLMHFPFNKATQNNAAVTGNIGLVYTTPKDLRLAFLVSSGFKSPNVDDLSKVFESAAGMVIVPNPDIKPEYTYNTELNFNKYAKNFSLGGAVYYTWFRNALVADKFQFNGQDSIIYDGVKSQVMANQNKASATVFGFNLNMSYTFAKNTAFEGSFTYTKGTYKNDGITMPLDHIPPVFGRIAIKHTAAKWNAAFFSIYNGWKRIKDYNLNGEDNEQYATADGMPSWFTLNLRGAVNLGKNSTLQLLAENLLDRNYRYFASGFSAAGRNFVISLKTGL